MPTINEYNIVELKLKYLPAYVDKYSDTLSISDEFVLGDFLDFIENERNNEERKLERKKTE